jgi:hypothetical protein
MAAEPIQSKKLDIEALKGQHRTLEKLKTTEEANLAHANSALEALKVEARKDYGTDDVAQLRAKLKEMEEENERLRADYQKHLETIQTKLDQVTREFEESGRIDE